MINAARTLAIAVSQRGLTKLPITSRRLAIISKGKVEIEAAIAVIDEEHCSGCKVCIDLCPYKAISFDEAKKVSRVNEALCKGCGTCVAACPAGAIKGRHFTTEEIMAEIEGALA